jgi:hypothetical protein
MAQCIVVKDAKQDFPYIYIFNGDSITWVGDRNNRELVRPGKSIQDVATDIQHKPLPNGSSGKDISIIDLDIGSYFPSDSRPVYPGPNTRLSYPNFHNKKIYIESIKREMRLIQRDLEFCFDVSTPQKKNLSTFWKFF